MSKIIVCADCGEEKEHYAKGLCQKCYRRGYYIANRQREITYQHDYRQSHREKCLAYGRKWYRENPNYHRQWRKNNPERVKAATSRCYERHQDERRAYGRAYHWKNRGKRVAHSRRYYRENTEKCKEASRSWRKNNPAKVRAQLHRRLASKRNSYCDLSGEDIQRMLAMGQAMYPGEDLHLDHIVPLSKGGNTTRGNITALPASVNISKRDRLPEEVYRQSELPLSN